MLYVYKEWLLKLRSAMAVDVHKFDEKATWVSPEQPVVDVSLLVPLKYRYQWDTKCVMC